MDPLARTGARDRAVDAGMVGFAVAYGVIMSLWLMGDPTMPRPVLLGHQIVGAVACGALWLRRRWPVGVALVLVPLSAFADLANGAQLVALFTVAVRRPVKIAVAVGAASLLTRSVVVVLADPPDVPYEWLVAFAATGTSAAIGWGLFARHRRQLVLSLRERAIRAENEGRLRAAQAQHRAREQIAREMHDVLGHRLSLLSVHAGALEYHPDAPAAEIARAAAVIRECAHLALQDLREVIGVLRAPVGELLPQPTLAGVRDLVAESRRAGMEVDLREEAAAGAVPDSVGRTAYRVVQEGLTNVRKHAPGAAANVTVSGAPGSGVTVEVRNTPPEAAAGAPPAANFPYPTSAAPEAAAETSSETVAAAGPEPAPGCGQGLIGLAERTALAGGRLEYAPTEAGGFRLAAWLPWPA
ncbi:MAG TPA: histidine kinase [Streptosporangiaceae bacterium]